jgi:hypothetical protein
MLLQHQPPMAEKLVQLARRKRATLIHALLTALDPGERSALAQRHVVVDNNPDLTLLPLRLRTAAMLAHLLLRKIRLAAPTSALLIVLVVGEHGAHALRSAGEARNPGLSA